MTTEDAEYYEVEETTGLGYRRALFCAGYFKDRLLNGKRVHYLRHAAR